ncbi:hypothetical protein L6R52_30550 [Myxococcota bacterium]|nr:hypothetical protein [Myxococcota bacterium]
MNLEPTDAEYLGAIVATGEPVSEAAAAFAAEAARIGGDIALIDRYYLREFPARTGQGATTIIGSRIEGRAFRRRK